MFCILLFANKKKEEINDSLKDPNLVSYEKWSLVKDCRMFFFTCVLMSHFIYIGIKHLKQQNACIDLRREDLSSIVTVCRSVV